MSLLDSDLLISHTRTDLVYTTASVQGSDGGVIAASKAHELLTKIHDIPESAVSKQTGNMAHILTSF